MFTVGRLMQHSSACSHQRLHASLHRLAVQEPQGRTKLLGYAGTAVFFGIAAYLLYDRYRWERDHQQKVAAQAQRH